MIKVVYFLLIVFIGYRLCSQEYVGSVELERSRLIISKSSNTFQLKNEAGNTILFDLDSVYYYKSADVFFVKKKSLWGVVSAFGKLIVPINFDKIERVYNSFWEVSKKNKKGIYNIYSGLVLPVEFDRIDFSNKVDKEFIVTNKGKMGIYNNYGQEVIPLIYDLVESTIGPIILKTNNKTSYFLENKVCTDSLNLNENFEVLEGKYPSDAKHYYVFYKKGACGVIDSKGNVVIEPKYQEILCKKITMSSKQFSFLLVKTNNQWGMINLHDKKIIPFTYQSIQLLDSSFAIVGLNNYKYFYNFSTNKLIEDFNFESFKILGPEYSSIKKDKKETLVENKKAFKLVMPFIYEYVQESGNWFIVKQNALYGIIDKNNNIIIPLKYKNLYISCDKIIAQKNVKYGILSIENKQLIPFEYINIVGYADKIDLQQTQNSKIKTIDCKLQCIANCD